MLYRYNTDLSIGSDFYSASPIKHPVPSWLLYKCQLPLSTAYYLLHFSYTMTSFTYYHQAQSSFKPPLIANENAFLGDVISRFVLPPFRPLDG